MVLLEAANQRNRSAKSNFPIAPPEDSPLQINFHAFKYSFNASIFISEEKQLNLFGLIWYLTSRNFFRFEKRMTPTLKNSSRSTLGTILIMAYSYLTLSCIFNLFN